MIGIDEVGRGSLIGSVYACACFFNEADVAHFSRNIKDSKKLSALQRNVLFKEFTLNSKVKFAIGAASIEEIEEINILSASLLAMKRAYDNLRVFDVKILVDGNQKPAGIPSEMVECVIGGDSTVIQISAASIIAKVLRDKEMESLSPVYPEYEFHKNKGYGTKSHFEAIKKHGITPVHRKSFLKSYI